MFRAIGKLLRTFGYLITGRIDRIRGVWATNPDVISATYDNVVAQKRDRLNTYKNAVGGLIAQEEKKKLALKTLTEEATRLENLRKGALAKAKKAVEKYNGDAAAAHADPEYQKCQQAYKDFSSTLEEKNKRIGELEADVKDLASNIANHQVQIQSLLRDLEKVKSEKYDTIADVVSAKEQKEIADMFSGISEDKTAAELAEMRDLRTKAKADARVSRELAGMDATKAEEDFLAYATESQATDEFDALLNLTKKEEVASAPAEATKISEN
jgi:phage shock protein A